MSVRITNRAFTGGSPDVPEGVGDVYRMQDMVRDQHFLEDKAAQAALDAMGRNQSKIILFGGFVEQGTGDTVTISALRAYVAPSVKVPNSYSSNPPTVTTENVLKRLVFAGVTNQTITSATLNGATTNYVKLAWADAGTGATRSRLKASGTWTYEEVEGYTLTVDSTAPTANEIQLATLVGSTGGTFTIMQNELDRFSPTSPQAATVAQGKAVGIGLDDEIEVAQIEEIDDLADAAGSPNGYASVDVCWISATRFVVSRDVTGQDYSIRIAEIDWSTGTLSWATDALTVGANFATTVAFSPIYQDDYFMWSRYDSNSDDCFAGICHYDGTTTINEDVAETQVSTAGPSANASSIAQPCPDYPNIVAFFFYDTTNSFAVRFASYNGTSLTLGTVTDITGIGTIVPPGGIGPATKKTLRPLIMGSDGTEITAIVGVYSAGAGASIVVCTTDIATLGTASVEISKLTNPGDGALITGSSYQFLDIVRFGNLHCRLLCAVVTDDTVNNDNHFYPVVYDIYVYEQDAFKSIIVSAINSGISTGVFERITSVTEGFLKSAWTWLSRDVFVLVGFSTSFTSFKLAYFKVRDGGFEMIGFGATPISITGSFIPDAGSVGLSRYSPRQPYGMVMQYSMGSTTGNLQAVHLYKHTLPIAVTRAAGPSSRFEWNTQCARLGEVVHVPSAAFLVGEPVYAVLTGTDAGSIKGESEISGSWEDWGPRIGTAVTAESFIYERS
jgi:hypothetical protein